MLDHSCCAKEFGAEPEISWHPWNDLIRRVTDQFQFTRAKVWKMDGGGATLKLRRKTIQGCPSLPLTWNCPLDALNFLEHSPSLLPCSFFFCFCRLLTFFHAVYFTHLCLLFLICLPC